MKNFSSWINKEFRKDYLDSSKRGLRIVRHNGVTRGDAEELVRFLAFLRKRYFFPIRCFIHLTNNRKYHSQTGGFCYGLFVPGEENKNHFPAIYLPIGGSPLKTNSPNLLYNLTCLLTYYFQWYFFLDEENDFRPLEREARKMAAYLTSEFYEHQ